jgi:hypothetical protein
MDGINYFKYDGVAGDYFHCPKDVGTFSTDFCARIYQEAMSPQGLKDGVRIACRGCVIGAGHAGVCGSSASRFLGLLSCSRCQKGATRLIRGSICVSCYNREREVLIGKNAKGNKPVHCKAVGSMYVACAIDAGESVQVRKSDKVSSLLEVYLSILRSMPKKVWFGMVNQMPVGANG